MCGIIGFLGKQNSIPFLINGLKLLQNRGYDSAGISYISNGIIETVKFASTNTHNSFTTFKPLIKKQAEPVPFIYTEDAFPELLVKTSNKINNQNGTNEELNKLTLVEKLKSKYNENIEENKRKQEDKRIQEEEWREVSLVKFFFQ